MLRQFRNCPYIVHTIGWSSGMLLELIPLSLLSFMNQLVTRKRRLSLFQVAKVLWGVLSALEVIHGCGVVHRDVKAENILVAVSRCGECMDFGIVCDKCKFTVKLADFIDAVYVGNGDGRKSSPIQGESEAPLAPTQRDGLTRIERPIPKKAGTAPYASPEAEAGKALHLASDMWSVGILALELLHMSLPGPQNPRTPGEFVVNPYRRQDGANGATSGKQLFRPKATLPSEDAFRQTNQASQKTVDPSQQATSTTSASSTATGTLSWAWLATLIDQCLSVNAEERPSAADALRLFPEVLRRKAEAGFAKRGS